jgi:hypothetical protein
VCNARGAEGRNKNIYIVDPSRNFLATVSNASGIVKYERNFSTLREFRVYSETD